VKYLLDSNVCIRYLTQRSPAIIARLQAIPLAEIAVCAVVKAEMFYGAMKSDRRSTTAGPLVLFFSAFVSLPFDDASANAFGRIRADLAKHGTPIGPYDLQIAAIALANSLILVTSNTRAFARVPGLRLDDWDA